jgi:hypothetical protein
MEQDAVTGLKYEIVIPNVYDFAFHEGAETFYKIQPQNSRIQWLSVTIGHDKDLQKILSKDLNINNSSIEKMSNDYFLKHYYRHLKVNPDWRHVLMKDEDELMSKGFISERTSGYQGAWCIMYPETLQTLTKNAPKWIKDKMQVLKQASAVSKGSSIAQLLLKRLCEPMLLHEKWSGLKPETKKAFHDILNNI